MSDYRLEHALRYRAPARRGRWKVESVGRIGYVCHHVDASGPDILRRAALVGVSRFESHADRDIVLVNYGHWSSWGCPAAGARLMAELLKPAKKKKMPENPEPLVRQSDDGSEEEDVEGEEDEDEEEESEEEWFEFDTDTDEERDNAIVEREEYEEALIMNRFMLVDEQGFPQLVQALREGFKLHSRNYLFRDNNHSNAVSDAFGVNLCIDYDKDNNGELGWLVFQRGELVGFVYDGACCDLDGRRFLCGDVERRRSGDEYMRNFLKGQSDADNILSAAFKAWSDAKKIQNL